MSDSVSRDHVPVLADELVELLDPAPGATVIDCTFGAGGHARRIAGRLGAEGTLICIDRDPAAERRYRELADSFPCQTRFVRGAFSAELRSLHAEGQGVDTIYLDLGVSSHQLDEPARGFSYAHDAPLDMRMDPDSHPSAVEVVNEWPLERLAAALRELGEERHSRAIAAEIGARRPLRGTADLVEAVRAAVPSSVLFGRGHPARRTFQAIRLAVNGELDELDAALPAAWDLLGVGGRLGVICFHSLEDRRVKRFLVDRARDCVCPPELPVCRCDAEAEAEIVTRKPVRPTEAEVDANPRSRSARLRVARKLAGGSEGRP